MAPRKTALSAVLVDRSSDDRAVGIVNRSRREHLAGLNQFVAGGDHGHTRFAHDAHLGKTASRQHAHLARAHDRAGAQQRLAARDIGSCVGYELPGRGGATDVDGGRSRRLGMLDHDHGIGTARQRTAGGNRRCRSRRHLQRGYGAAVNSLAIQPEANLRTFAGCRKVR
ncbi:hypothetical protein ACVIQY_001952 [Bradyrhizobium sp. USDA 3051]